MCLLQTSSISSRPATFNMEHKGAGLSPGATLSFCKYYFIYAYYVRLLQQYRVAAEYLLNVPHGLADQRARGLLLPRKIRQTARNKFLELSSQRASKLPASGRDSLCRPSRVPRVVLAPVESLLRPWYRARTPPDPGHHPVTLPTYLPLLTPPPNSPPR